MLFANLGQLLMLGLNLLFLVPASLLGTYAFYVILNQLRLNLPRRR